LDTKIVYRTDELENAIDYLEQAACYYVDSHSKHRFKWLMIALHGALYGFGVLAIKGSNASATVYKPINSKRLRGLREQVAKYHNESDERYIDMFIQPEHGKLLAIYDVLDKCQDESYMIRFVNSKVLVITEDQRTAIGKMIEFRNQFAHFKPSLYAITGDYNKDIVIPVIKVISELALESNNVMYYEVEQKDRVEKAFYKILKHE